VAIAGIPVELGLAANRWLPVARFSCINVPDAPQYLCWILVTAPCEQAGRVGLGAVLVFVTKELRRASNVLSCKKRQLQLQHPRRSGPPRRVVDLLEPQVSFQHPRSGTKFPITVETTWLELKAATKEDGYSTDH